MINNLIQLHSNLFFQLHSVTNISKSLNEVIYFIAEELDVYIVVIAVIFMVLHTHKYKENKPRLISRRSLTEGVYLVIGVLLAWGISYLMKIGFAIPRPFLQFPEITPLFYYGGYNSFPSGHATLFAGLATAITLVHRKIGIFFIVVALLIGVTRIISGVHFPVDIVFGWLLGSYVSYITYRYLAQKNF